MSTAHKFGGRGDVVPAWWREGCEEVLMNGFRISVTGTEGMEVTTSPSSSGVALPFEGGRSTCFDMVR